MGKRKDKLRACTCWLWKIWAIKSANTRPYKILQLVTSILLNSCLQVGLWYWFTFFLIRGNLVQLQIFMHPWTLWRWELHTNCAELGLCFEVMRTGMNQGFLHSLPCRIIEQQLLRLESYFRQLVRIHNRNKLGFSPGFLDQQYGMSCTLSENV